MIESIQKTAAALAQPDEHIPAIETTGICTEGLAEMVRLFSAVVFDGFFGSKPLAESLMLLAVGISHQVAHAARIHPGKEKDAEAFGIKIAKELIDRIPELRRRLGTDVQAVFDSDPAAHSREEVILCYPAIREMIHYRLAHELHLLGVPIIPRLITESAHSVTGIDIHPGAVIGDYFSIDHGTGIVIGETCVIGNHVRLYQGVTLGARNIKYDNQGNVVNEPRHPILEDRVVVYSNTSILGRVRIGHDTIVGGNVWLTTNLPPFSRVVQSQAELISRE